MSGSFSRTAVNAASGARTQMAGIISAGVVALTLVVLTPFFRPLPNAVLASVVIMAVAGLVDVREARRLWRVKRSDFWLLAVAFAATLLLGVQLGLGISVVASLVVVLRQTTRPHIAVLGRIPGTAQFRNVERSPAAETTDGVVVVRSTPRSTSPTSTTCGSSCSGWRKSRTGGCACSSSTPAA